MRPIVILILLLASALAEAPVSSTLVVDTHRPAPTLATAERFHRAIEQKMSATWRRMPLRAVLQAVSREREISILLDRRIDPNQLRPWEFAGLPLRLELIQLAEKLDAAVSFAGNTVYIGPRASAMKIRTLVKLREDELLAVASKLPKGRDLELFRTTTTHWSDLARPAELVQSIAQKHDLKIDGLENIPHDLWAGGTIPSASVAEALTLILIQFDLAFAWTEDTSGIRIHVVPEKVEIAKSYEASAPLKESRISIWKKEHPAATLVEAGGRYEVTANVEAHESFAKLLMPGTANPLPRPTVPSSLTRQKFTLKVDQIAFRVLLKELANRNIDIEFNEKELAAAGIDLGKRIDIDVSKAGPEEFFEAVCKPMGLQFRIDKNKVLLSPAAK